MIISCLFTASLHLISCLEVWTPSRQNIKKNIYWIDKNLLASPGSHKKKNYKFVSVTGKFGDNHCMSGIIIELPNTGWNHTIHRHSFKTKNEKKYLPKFGLHSSSLGCSSSHMIFHSVKKCQLRKLQNVNGYRRMLRNHTKTIKSLS